MLLPCNGQKNFSIHSHLLASFPGAGEINLDKAEGVIVVLALPAQTWYTQILQVMMQQPRVMLWTPGTKLLIQAGMDIATFKPHSTRRAASTAAIGANIPVDEILKRAGWSNATTFRDLY